MEDRQEHLASCDLASCDLAQDGALDMCLFCGNASCAMWTCASLTAPSVTEGRISGPASGQGSWGSPRAAVWAVHLHLLSASYGLDMSILKICLLHRMVALCLELIVHGRKLRLRGKVNHPSLIRGNVANKKSEPGLSVIHSL